MSASGWPTASAAARSVARSPTRTIRTSPSPSTSLTIVHDRAEEKTAGFRLEFAVTAIERYELAEYGVWESVAAFGLQGARG